MAFNSYRSHDTLNSVHPMISVVIPTLNEETTLADVIQRCRPFADEIIVVDGNSTDHTADIARANGVPFIQQKGRGKGSALRQSSQFARGDILVFIDADGSHMPEDIPKLTEPIKNNKADLV